MIGLSGRDAARLAPVPTLDVAMLVGQYVHPVQDQIAVARWRRCRVELETDARALGVGPRVLGAVLDEVAVRAFGDARLDLDEVVRAAVSRPRWLSRRRRGRLEMAVHRFLSGYTRAELGVTDDDLDAAELIEAAACTTRRVDVTVWGGEYALRSRTSLVDGVGRAWLYRTPGGQGRAPRLVCEVSRAPSGIAADVTVGGTYTYSVDGPLWYVLRHHVWDRRHEFGLLADDFA